MADFVSMPARRPAVIRTYLKCSFKEATDLIDRECGDVFIAERHGKGPNKVILLPEATQELCAITSYGRRSPMNAQEQKLYGMGHFMIDEQGNKITAVSHLIEIQTMNRSPVSASNLGPNGEPNHGLDFLAYHREEYLRTEAKFNTDVFGHTVDPFLKRCGPSEFVLEGHTHPDLGVFYSQPDRTSGAARATTGPICIFVCDPIRRKMLGKTGKDFDDAEIIVYAHRQSLWGAFTEARELPPPAGDISQLAAQCLRLPGFAGSIKMRGRPSGRSCLRIKLLIPKEKQV